MSTYINTRVQMHTSITHIHMHIHIHIHTHLTHSRSRLHRLNVALQQRLNEPVNILHQALVLLFQPHNRAHSSNVVCPPGFNGSRFFAKLVAGGQLAQRLLQLIDPALHGFHLLVMLAAGRARGRPEDLLLCGKELLSATHHHQWRARTRRLVFVPLAQPQSTATASCSAKPQPQAHTLVGRRDRRVLQAKARVVGAQQRGPRRRVVRHKGALHAQLAQARAPLHGHGRQRPQRALVLLAQRLVGILCIFPSSTACGRLLHLLLLMLVLLLLLQLLELVVETGVGVLSLCGGRVVRVGRVVARHVLLNLVGAVLKQHNVRGRRPRARQPLLHGRVGDARRVV
eukprot:m.108476 g.108476  ORF g.108476 m.108476 type:complete len:342 (-) comp15869_c0_seq2:105-1130(-)